jgi:hypothetical protein
MSGTKKEFIQNIANNTYSMLKPKFTVVHRADRNNVGDLASNPLQYFLKPEEYQVVDIAQIKETGYDSTLPMVVGGGGLVANEFFGNIVQSLLPAADLNQLAQLQQYKWTLQDPANEEIHKKFLTEHRHFIKKFMDKIAPVAAPRHLWGVGHNGPLDKRGDAEILFPDWLMNFDQVGVRDWNQNQPWAPCASCMHPALRKKYAIKNDVIFFEHKKQLIKNFGNDSIPRFVNSGSNIDQTIELLGTANIILTNSYHGAFWGVLLGKKVIVIEPWSSKFLNMKHTPLLLNRDQDWKDVVDQVKIRNGALDDCRHATKTFWEKIK